MSNAFRTLIIAAQDAPLARDIARTVGGPAGDGMWITGLSADGAEPATHYISTGYIGSEFAAMVPDAEWTQDESGQWVEVSNTPGNPLLVVVACANADPPLVVTLEQVQGIYSRCDVTEQDPFVALGRLGLQIVQTEMADA